MKLAKKMDLPGSNEQVRVIPVQHADAGDLGNTLNQLIFNKGKKTSPFSSGKRTGRSKTLPPHSRQKNGREISKSPPSSPMREQTL